jgi:hypothetical protein
VKAGEREEERLAREVVARIRTWAEKRKRAAGADSLPHLAIKFCGGCNPIIDRGQLARSIREHLTGLVRWVPPEEEVDLLLIISGCLTACVDRPEVTEKAAEYFVIAGSRIVFIQRNPGKEQR